MKPSSYIEFVRYMRGKKWNRVKIHREFRARVDKSDYSQSDVDAIMRNLSALA